jgi:hypothetical protein
MTILKEMKFCNGSYYFSDPAWITASIVKEKVISLHPIRPEKCSDEKNSPLTLRFLDRPWRHHLLDFSPFLGYFLLTIFVLEGTMTPEDIKARIKAAAPQGRIACPVAFRLAEELGLSRRDLGELLNELKIKIIQCQLGCF